jgi:hypothetical protein
MNRESMNSVEGLKMLKVWSQQGWGEITTQIDVQVPGVSKETSFRHEGQKA